MNTVHAVGTVRTPVGRHDGALAGVRPDHLAALAVGELPARTPAPLAGTLAHRLARRGSGTGVAILPVGVGQGPAPVLER